MFHMEHTTYPEWVQTESEQKLHDDFRAFLWLIWTHLKLPAPTRRQLAIAAYIQHGPPRRMVQAWRGAAKTFITCAYVLWRLYRNPNERVRIVSANEDKAIENATFIRRLIDEVPQLHFLRPKAGRDSVLAFDVGPADAQPTASVTCTGITGQLTGGRATIIVSDDVEVPKNSFTETMREKLAELIKEYDALVVPEGFDIIVLGTPQTEQSIYRLLRERGYDCRIWPVRYPSPGEEIRYGGALAPDLVADLAANPALAGTTVEPTRFSEADLLGREASYGRSGFALQFMLDTTLSDNLRYPLKLSDLIVMDIAPDQGPVRVEYTGDPRNAINDLPNPGFSGDRFYRPLHISDERAAWQGTAMVIDPSGRGADETAWAVGSQLHGKVFLRGVGGFTDGYSDETLKGLAMIAREYGCNRILVEDTYGDGMFTKLFEPVLAAIYPCTIEPYKVTGQKEARIIADLEPVLNQHRLVVDPAVVKQDIGSAEPKYSLFYQMTHLTKERGSLRHDDRVEVVARLCRYFRDLLAQDASKAELQHRAKLQDEQMRSFMLRAKRQVPRRTYTGMPQGVTLSTPKGRSF
jgi:hypothetical protein